MRPFHEYNPYVILAYFAAASGVVMSFMNPFIVALSLVFSLVFYNLECQRRRLQNNLSFLLIYLALALVSPVFVHNGRTVLFVLNNNPVTLEAVLYGLFSAGMVTSVVIWFRIFSGIMTGDKLQYLFGSLSGKTALVLSMALRFVPLFRERIRKIQHTQKALGLYREDNAIDTIRGGLRVFSVMVTWALENGIITADSMAARGYGTGRRTFFRRYRFRKADGMLLLLTLLLLSGTLYGIFSGALAYGYYPDFYQGEPGPGACFSLISYGLLLLLPSIHVYL